VQLFYEDGTRISANSDINVLLKKSEEKQPIQLKNKKHLKKSHFIYDATEEQFLNKSLHKLDSFPFLRRFHLKFPFLNIFSSMNEVNEKAFSDSKTIRLFGMQLITDLILLRLQVF
jgi:hypothetical protein